MGDLIYHSGKTYEALLRLKSAKSGLYCGPLRLLAEEVYARMNSQNVPCNLVTGQRLIQSGQACHTSCTVEMADTSQYGLSSPFHLVNI